jgi:calcium-dependent protein kinase
VYLALKLKCSTRKWTKQLSSPKPIHAPRYNINKHYDVEGKIGFGTYSQVFAGTNKETKLKVAIKKCKGTTNINRLQQEYDLLSTITHPHIPDVHDFKVDEVNNTAYMVMDYFEGVPIDTYVELNGVPSAQFTNQVILELVNTIKYLHDKGICHRDVKPQNVLIDSSNHIKLIDFNISKCVYPEGHEKGCRKMHSFKLMTQIGSPLFAAPEIYSADCYTEKIDIWGIGIAYLHLVLPKDKIPLQFDSFNESQLLSEESKNFLSYCLTLNPDDRYSVDELLANEVLQNDVEL